MLIEVQGFCEGEITFSPKGNNGFGYDPIFEVSGLGETYAEMNSNKKKHIGHRGNAFKLLIPELQNLLSLIEH